MSATGKGVFTEHATQIGYFFINWGTAEGLLIVLLSALLKTDQTRGKMLFSEWQAHGHKFKLMKRLARAFMAESPEKSEVLKILSDAQSLSDRRNAYAHASWGTDVETGKVVMMRGTANQNDKKPLPDREFIAVEDIRADARKAGELARELSQFCRDKLPTVQMLGR